MGEKLIESQKVEIPPVRSILLYGVETTRWVVSRGEWSQLKGGEGE